MNTPAAIGEFVTAKRSGVALLIFVVGLLAPPAVFTASGIYYRAGSPISWRPGLDYFEWLAAAFGLFCCVTAPFLPKIPVRRQLFLCLVAVGTYAIDLGFSAVAGMIVFGAPFN